MFGRVFGAYLAVLVAGLGVLAVALAVVTRNRLLDETSARLDAEARMARWALEAPDPDAALKAVRTDTRLTIVAADGTVLADSIGDPGRMENHNGRPEVMAARATGRGQDVRRSGSIDVELMYVAVVHADVVLRAALPLSHIDAELDRLYAWIGGVFVGVLALAGAAGFVAVRGVVRPLQDMAAVAGALASGDFSQRAPLEAPADIAVLGRALNAMSDELRRRLDEARAEASRVQAVLASMEEGVIALGADGRVHLSNAAAERLLGGGELWQMARVREAAEAAREALAGREARADFDHAGRRLAVAAVPVASGGAVIVVRDVTAPHRYETLRREFVANVSHELRTPLTMIRGFVETLRDGALDDPERAAEFLATIDRHAAQLSVLVEDLLELSRLDAAPGLDRRRVRIDELLARVQAAFAPAAERKRQTLRVEAPPLTVEVDPDMMERAVGNLVDNAIKYTPKEGVITVSATAPCTIEVSDTGIGIPEADRARIFERFYRVDKPRSREAGGTGLGLAIVKHIAQLHGGSVCVEGAPGGGSRFRLTLQAAAGAEGLGSVA